MNITSTQTPIVNRLHLIAIKHGLMARQHGLFITSPRKGGSTSNLLALLSSVTGYKYPKGKAGISLALHHIGILLLNSMDAEAVAAQEAERTRLIERSRAVCD